MEGFYKYVNGEWAMAPNGIVLPYTTEPTLDPQILNENGWFWYEEAPQENLNWKDLDHG